METMSSTSDSENNNSLIGSGERRNASYRHLLNELDDIKESDDLGMETVEKIGRIIYDLNIIDTEKAKDNENAGPEEDLLDSMVLSAASGLLLQCTHIVDVNLKPYEPAEFARKMALFCTNAVHGEDEEYHSNDLMELVDDALKIVPTIPVFSSVYGHYNLNQLPETKQRKERVRVQREELQKKAPEKVTNLEELEKGIEEIVKEFYVILDTSYKRNNNRPIKYYDYVIDTDSFEATVENMFYCSFLMRDGRAHLDMDRSTGVPYITPTKSKKLDQFRANNGMNTQIISTIQYDQWETFTKKGLIQTCKNKNK